MNFSHFFITRPIFAGVLSVMIFLIGLIAMFRLPVSEYPEVVPPTVVVRAIYPGANPATIAETVAAPLEQQINGVENSLYMVSQATADGVMTLTITFKLGTEVNQAQVLVQNRVAQALPTLPEEVRRLGVTTTKQSPDLTMVVHLFSPDGRYDDVYVRNYATLQVKDVLSRVPGVGQVQIFGSGDYAMRVWLDPEKVAARNLTAGDVVAAIREQNVQVAAGAVGQQPLPTRVDTELLINTKGRLVSEEEFGDIIVRANGPGDTVYLRDLARIDLGAGTYALRSLLNNKAAVALPIFQMPGSNALQLSKDVRAAMVTLKQDFPQGLDYSVVYDPTVFVDRSIDAVIVTLFEAIGLVVLVVLVFLQTWRASIIPLAAVPVSLVGTFAVMHALGFGINALSLFGLVLAIGIVVDDAIVVVENVERNLARGLSPIAATKQAMTEVTGPIVATALVLCGVFIPTAFISGLTGQFYKQFAITIAISTVISAFNSLTLSPALSSVLLRAHGSRPDLLTRAMNLAFGWFFRPFNRLFAWSSLRYAGGVRAVIRRSGVVLLLYAGLAALTWVGFDRVPTGFVPTQDKQYLVAFAQLPDAASLERTDDVIRRMSDIALQHPGVEASIAFPGLSINGFANASNAGIVFVSLKPFEQRTAPELGGIAIAQSLQRQYGAINDAFVAIFPPPAVQGLGTIGGFKLFVEDRADQGYDALYRATWDLVGKASKAPALAGTFSGFQVNVPQLRVDVDRKKAKEQGVPLSGVFEAMQVFLGSLYVNDFNRFGRTWQVVAQADASFRDRPDDILRLKARNARGDMVPLGSLVTIADTSGPDRVMHYNGYPAAEVNGAPAPGFSSGQAEAVMGELARTGLQKGMSFEWTELTLQKILAGNTAVYVFPLCILLVFLVLAAQYESFRLPLAVILIVPMSLLSAIAGVWFVGGDNNVFTQIGLIVLIGLAAKNAILIVEFAKVKLGEGKSPRDAAVEAARLRLRPILMTSIAFIAGVFPLVVSTGAGAEMRRAMGVAVFSGMIGVTVFGLLLTPVFFVVLESIGRKPRSTPAPAPPAGHGDHAPAAGALPLAVGAGLVLAGSLLLPGCTVVGADYARPAVETPAEFAQLGAWKPSAPADATPRGDWWTMFGDPVLDALQDDAAAANQDLRAALARIEDARALVRNARADQLPSLDFDGKFDRTRYSPNAGLAFPIDTASNTRLALGASWEIDLFGRVRRGIEAAANDAEARIAAFESVQLALHAEVARTYFTLRANDAELAALRRTFASRQAAVEFARARYEAGAAPELDLARAETELSTIEAELRVVERQASELRTGLAVLLGKPAPSFTLAAVAAFATGVPQVPVGLPSALLERRPDVAQAERELAAANARIGVAEGGFFPAIRLTGAAGYESSDLGDMFDWNSRVWSFGPQVSLPIFQGGRLRAALDRARATYEEAVAHYRQRVLVAFQEVQDALNATTFLAGQAEAEQRALAAAQRAVEAARTRYAGGFVAYLEVVDSERSFAATERAVARTNGQRLVNAVRLLQALGGGFQATAIATGTGSSD